MAINNKHTKEIVIGIDATNLRRGGGVTHIVELLNAVEPEKHNIGSIVVWGGKYTLEKLPDQDWIKKVSPAALNRGLLSRSFWQAFSLSDAAKAEQCDVLLAPGGNYTGSFRPSVTMSRNLLPFEWRELRRYGLSSLALKLVLLRFIQSRSFRKVDGLIFLTEYARQAVLKVTGRLPGKTATIPHGLNSRFRSNPKDRSAPSEYTAHKPCRLLYVSIIDQYKHQHQVVEAVRMLREEGLPVILDLVGPAYKPALKRLRSIVSRVDPAGNWVHYHGAVPYETLHKIYAQADIGIFASSCENMPNILLETMAAGLPVACSDRGPMPEVLGDSGLYFDPESASEIAHALRRYIESPELRNQMASAGFERAGKFSWSRTADKTFAFLADLARDYRK